MSCCGWVWTFRDVNSLEDAHKESYQRFRKDELQVKVFNVRKRVLYRDIARVCRLERSEK